MRIQKILAKFRGSCKDFAASAALAEVCGFRVRLVLNCGSVVLICNQETS